MQYLFEVYNNNFLKLILFSYKNYEIKMKEKRSLRNRHKDIISERREYFRSTFIHVAVTIVFMVDCVMLIIVNFHDIFLMGSKPPSRGNGSREQGKRKCSSAFSHATHCWNKTRQ